MRLLRAIPRTLKQQPIDAILFSSMVTASTAWRLQKTLGSTTPLLAAIVHGRDVTLPFGPYQRFVPHVFRALDLVLPVSTATRVACTNRGLDPDKAVVVPNGVDPDRFKESPLFSKRRVALRKGIPAISGLSDNDFVLCSVGRHVPRKGFDWFVDKVMPLLPEHVHYVLAGEGETFDRVAAAAVSRNLNHRVHQLGRVPVDTLEALYRGADLFVMPNRRVEGDMEGFGVVLLEASLCGLPTLGAALEGIRDAITEGRNGWLVEPENPEKMARAIHDRINQPELLKEMSTQTRSFTVQNHSWTGIADKMLRVLSERIQGKISRSAS
jgi:phosphatidylinositol alpha-1,6-mannosyltransferase